MSSRDRPRDDDLEERLDELEDVLSELRQDLRASERDRRGPPRLSELVRFTEQYTIPTVIALLETTITSLELARGALRLVDPGRDLEPGSDATADRLSAVRDGATTGLTRSLAELRTALSEADLPEEAASRSIIEDARDLSADIESRIEEGRREADAGRRRRDGDRDSDRPSDDDRRQRDEGAVHIDVTDPDGDADGGAGDAPDDPSDGDPPDDGPEVDVEAELDSIKRQLGDVEGSDGRQSANEDEDTETRDDHAETADDHAETGDDHDPDDGDGSETDDSADA